MLVVIITNDAGFGKPANGLEVAVQLAKSNGNDVAVLKGDNYINKEFRAIYRHQSPNPYWFEVFCAERWFLLKEWMEETGNKSVFHADCDVLIFDNLEAAWPRRDFIFTIPPSSGFVKYDGVCRICERLMDAFSSSNPDDYTIEPGKWMEFLIIAKLGRDLKQPDLFEDNCHTQICNNLFLIGSNRVQHDDHRDIWFINGIPWWSMNGEMRRGATLHCWGRSKTKMAEIVEQSKQSFTRPIRLTI